MKIYGDIVAINLKTGRREQLVVGNGTVTRRPV